MRGPITIGGLCERAVSLNEEAGASSAKLVRLGFAAKWICATYEEVNGTEEYSNERLGKVAAALVELFPSGGICYDTFRRRRGLVADVEDVADYGAIGADAHRSPWRRERNPLLRPISDEVRSDGESIVGLSLAVLDEMARTGYSESTMRSYRNCVLPRVVWYFAGNGTDRYSDELIDAFVDGVEADACFGGLTDCHQYLQPAAMHIRAMHDEGRLHSRTGYGGRLGRAKRGPFGALISEFADWRAAAGAKAGTVAHDVDAVLPFLEALCPDGPGGLGAVTREGVRLARRRLGDSRSPGTVNGMLTSLRAFARFAEERHPEVAPFGQWLGPNARVVARRPIGGYEPEYADAIVAAVDDSTDVGKRDLAILRLLKNTGMRGCDVVALKLDDIDWRASEIHVVQEKTGVAVSLPLDAEAGEAIATYLLEARRDCAERVVFTTVVGAAAPLLPNTINAIVKKHASRVDGREYDGPHGPHSFRRGLGASLAAAEVPLGGIADVLGQSGPRSAMPYVAVAVERLRACCAGLDDIPGAQGGGEGDAE